MRFDATRLLLLSSYAVSVAVLAACSELGSDGSVTPNPGVSGSWSTPGTTRPSIRVELTQTESSLSGTGTIGVPPLAPVTGPATPAYTGDNFTITSGRFDSPTLSFIATLGANPDGMGGFYHGTVSFSGTLSGGTMLATFAYTPPRTATQSFERQIVTGVALTKP